MTRATSVETEVRKFARILRDSRGHGGEDSEWLWVVGAGITAAVTGNWLGATWFGLIKAAIEYFRSQQISLGLLDSVVLEGENSWVPTDSANLFAAVDIIAAAFGETNSTQRWIYDKMRELEANVIAPELLAVLGEYSWPLATTNYDNILALALTNGKFKTLVDVDVLAIQDWRREAGRFILHLHGHSSKAESLLFTKASYDAYLRRPEFASGMREVFRGRPVFVGCKDTLIDPSIGHALRELFLETKDHSREPIVLHRAAEALDFKIPVQRVCYGVEYSDLLPFLKAVLAEIRPARARQISADAATIPAFARRIEEDDRARVWQDSYLTAIEMVYRNLQLADFRSADREVPLPLDDIYVALVFDPRTAQERLEESRTLHHTQAGATFSGEPEPFQRPIPASAREYRPVTLADALRDNQILVVLGDPGCGKTTLTHWLIRQCALARLGRRLQVLVEPLRLKADADPSSGLQTVGPAWLPVLVPIQEYALKRLELGAEPRQRLRLYLTVVIRDRLADAGIDVPAADVSHWLDEEASCGRLLVLVDGLDESSNDEERRNIVDEVQFLREWVCGFDPTGARASNRILITSRIAGYKNAPLSIDVAHYNVEPLTPVAVERLVRQLFAAVGRSSGSDDSSSTASLDKLCEKMLQQLRNEPVSSLAANPVLASALFTLFLAREGELPQDRRELYQGVIDLFMRREIGRLQLDEQIATQLRRLFQELAFEAFLTPRSGLISEDKIRQKISTLGGNSIRPRFNSVFGPLAPKMPGEYGFIHRTFQEYLCAEYLTRSGQKFKEVVSFAGMPTWSEPARLAFMIWAKSNGAEAPQGDLDILETGSSLANSFRPVALAIAALCETTDPAAELCCHLAGIAVNALARALPHWTEVPEDLADALRLMCKQEAGMLAVDDSIEDSLRSVADPEDRGRKGLRAATAARLIVALDRFDLQLVEALQQAYPYDVEGLDWPVTAALLRAITPELSKNDAREAWVAFDKSFTGRSRKKYRLSEAAEHFVRHPQELDELFRSSLGARLLVALLGGHRDYRLREATQRFRSIAAFLQLPDMRRGGLLLSIPIDWGHIAEQHRKEGADEDVVYELAVSLDTTVGERMNLAAAIPPAFQIRSCVVPTTNWRSVCQRMGSGSAAAAQASPVLDICVNPRSNPVLSTQDSRCQAHNLRYRLSDAARRAFRTMTADEAHIFLNAVPEPYHVAVLDALADRKSVV